MGNFRTSRQGRRERTGFTQYTRNKGVFQVLSNHKTREYLFYLSLFLSFLLFDSLLAMA